VTTLSAGRRWSCRTTSVGRRTITLVDARARRPLARDVDLWYPAAASDAPKSVYEVLPGVAYAAATAQHEAPALSGQYPLILFSHGRTGMRISYGMVCEALAARGAIVVSSDHPGRRADGLADRPAGGQPHERDQPGRRRTLRDLGAAARRRGPVPVEIANAIDHERIALAGHSYGAFTAFGTAAGSRGVAPHPKVRAVVGFQAYTEVMSDGLLGRIDVPALLVVSAEDQVTPPGANADRPWALLRGEPTWRLDLAGGGHQAISDIPLYAELADQVPGLPDLVRDYLRTTAEGSSAAAGRTWREAQQLQVAAAWAFLQVTLALDAAAGLAMAEQLEHTEGLTLRRR
jgi:predicted dienelactone hydrolase